MISTDRRNYGIDIARIVSMLMVVFLHNLLNGGILANLDIVRNPIGMVYWFVENCSIVAVNVFALITGYLMVDRKISFKKIIDLWKTVLFWSIFICLICLLFKLPITSRDIIVSFFPTIMKNYWYFNAYIMLFLFIPFLNAGINMLDDKFFEKLIFLLVGFSITLGFIGHWFEMDGYSGIWLIILYLVGAYIKLSTRIQHVDNIHIISIYIISMLVSVCAEYISLRFIGGTYHWISYISPMVVVSSICLFILLTRIRVKNIKVRKVLAIISPLTFAVYLIDSHPIVYNVFIKNSFSNIADLNVFKGLLILFSVSILMFSIFILMEYSRVNIFSYIYKIYNERKIKKDTKIS